MHIFDRDAQKCMHYVAYWNRQNYIAFVGDSRVRQFYFSFIELIGNEQVTPFKAHSDLHFHDDKLNTHIVSLIRSSFTGKIMILLILFLIYTVRFFVVENLISFENAYIKIVDACVQLQAFIWQPIANRSMLETFENWLNDKPSARPGLIITSSAVVSLQLYSNTSHILYVAIVGHVLTSVLYNKISFFHYLLLDHFISFSFYKYSDSVPSTN